MTVSVDDTIALVTAAQAKSYLRITASTEDELIATLINAMSQLVKTYCGRDFVETDFTEYYDGDGTATLVLRNYPILDVTSIHNADAQRTFDSSTEIDVTEDVIIDNAGGILRLWNNESGFLCGHANVKVVYSSGYETIPWDLQQATLHLIGNAYKRQYQDQRFGIQSETINQRTVTFTNDPIPKAVALVLEKYRAFAGANRGL
jgi:uncharacterized phiE125 gp8 family phage protein